MKFKVISGFINDLGKANYIGDILTYDSLASVPLYIAHRVEEYKPKPKPKVAKKAQGG